MLKAGIASTAVHLLALLLGVLTTVLLSRAMGADGYGVYAFAYAVVMVLTIPVQAGVPTLVMRETARFGSGEQYGLMLKLWNWSGRVVIIGALCVAVLNLLLTAFWQADYKATLVVSTALIPFLALSAIRSAALKGLHRVIIGQLPDIIVRPLLLFIAVGVIYFMGMPVSPELAMGAHVVSAGLAFALGVWLLRHYARHVLALSGATASEPITDETRSWKRDILPLSGVNALQALNSNIGILAVGAFSQAFEVGLLKVAVTVAGVLMFGRTAIISIVQPRMAVAYKNNEYDEFQKLAGMVSLVSFLTTLIISIALLVAGKWALPMVFGTDFAAAWPALLLVMGGQLVNSFFASVGSCLMMARKERLLLRSLVVVSLLSIPVYVALSARYGAMGAALAMALHNGVLHAIYWFVARKSIDVDASPVKYVQRVLLRQWP